MSREGPRNRTCQLRSPSVSEELQKPQPLLVSEKVLQYISNLYGSTFPICITVLSWLLSFAQGKPGSTHPVCTAVRLPFVRQYFEKVLGLGSPESNPLCAHHTSMLSSVLDTSCLQRLGATWVTAVPSTKSKVKRLQRGSTGQGQSMYANWDGFRQNRFQEALKGDILKGDI